ncbi:MULTISPECIES: S4 domain-containing protein [Ponticaulis]|uniref:RNA-binding S4 domain-containing protein n=1 Tax=Ponticaulis TaxID=1123044 RepID=UPI0003B71AA7|nr:MULTISPECIES: S4 domain-containing protein [Ponticaulis]MDF1679530.1 S4 domain-containing protein [Ponticaulis sp.]
MAETEQRLDIWLWRARFFKMRADAAKAVSQKGVRIDRTGMIRKSQKPGATVCEGDILTFRARGQVLTVRVLGLPLRRGPAAEAQGFYESVSEESEG